MIKISHLNTVSPTKTLLMSLFLITFCGFAQPSQASEVDSDRLIIKYRSSVDAPQSISTRLGGFDKNSAVGRTVKLKRLHAAGDNTAVYSLVNNDDAASINDVLSQLRQNDDIEYVEADLRLQTNFVPNDARYHEQWHLTEEVAGLQMESVWDEVTGEGVVVAVIDSGYIEHQDLSANLLPGYDMISNVDTAADGDGRDADATDMGDGETETEHTWHGTHTAGTIAAIANNGKGVVGIAHNAKIVPVRAIGRDGGFISDIAASVIWAAGGFVHGVPSNKNPAQVINMSLGGEGECGQTMQTAIDTAVELGATVVVSAGNDQQNVTKFVPASCNNVITVGAVNRSGARAYYSNYGHQIEISAAGGEIVSSFADGILSTWQGNGNAFYEGTSMAAPQVAAVAALLYQAKPEITPAEVAKILSESARPFTGECELCGSGIIDPAAALARLNSEQLDEVVADVALENNVSAEMFAMQAGAVRYYTLSVPEGASDLEFELRADNGDADMYVAFGKKPTETDYDCRSIEQGSIENCEPAIVEAGTYYVMVVAAEQFTGAVLFGRFNTQVINPVITTEAAAPQISTNSGGGGGGSISWTLLLMPMLFLLRRRQLAVSKFTGGSKK